MKRNGFTLIELLIAIAIICILAAVGVVAYNMYEKAAATKSNHKLAVKYIAAELEKCNLGETQVLVADPTNRSSPSFLTCSEASAIKAQTAAVQALNHIKNPYDTTKVATRSGEAVNDFGDAVNDTDVGYLNLTTVQLSSGEKVISIKSCFKTSCSNSKNRLEDTVALE